MVAVKTSRQNLKRWSLNSIILCRFKSRQLLVNYIDLILMVTIGTYIYDQKQARAVFIQEN